MKQRTKFIPREGRKIKEFQKLLDQSIFKIIISYRLTAPATEKIL